ncbi:MAG: c-type cytochrome biogenesis protein CcsB [Cyanobacteria bacterium P01_D01_bin.73]
MDLVLLQSWLDNASFLALFITMLAYWTSAAFPQWSALWSLGTTGMAIANLTMATLLGARWIEAGYFPLSNLYESLFFLAWGITAVHLFAEYSSRSRWVGTVTAPAAMGITAFAALTLPDTMQASAPLVPALKSNWLMMHVSVMMLSYATLMVGSLMAIAFLVITRGQNIVLRGSSFGGGSFRDKVAKIQTSVGGNGLPLAGALADTTMAAMAETDLDASPDTGAAGVAVLDQPADVAIDLSPQLLSLADTLDNVSYRIIGLGFPLLTIGIIAGGVWANEAWGSYWSWDPKETWALITWLVFAAYLHARITRGWQGRRPALLAAGGFVVVWICYLGVNILGKGLHSYGWFL